MCLFSSGIGRLCLSPGKGFLPRASTEGDTSTVYFLLTQPCFDAASSRAGFVPIKHRSGSRTISFSSSLLKVLGSKVEASKGGDGALGVSPENNFGIGIFEDFAGLSESKLIVFCNTT